MLKYNKKNANSQRSVQKLSCWTTNYITTNDIDSKIQCIGSDAPLLSKSKRAHRNTCIQYMNYAIVTNVKDRLTFRDRLAHLIPSKTFTF